MTEFTEEYGSHAFDGCPGQRVPVTDRPGGRVIGSAVVTSADGSGVTAEITLDRGAGLPALAGMPAMSFAFPELEALPRDVLAAREPEIRWDCSGRPEDSP